MGKRFTESKGLGPPKPPTRIFTTGGAVGKKILCSTRGNPRQYTKKKTGKIKKKAPRRLGREGGGWEYQQKAQEGRSQEAINPEKMEWIWN